jgi:nucleotide-binding universal stress UspA family protein
MTTSLAPIVVGVDGSPHSERAVDWAAREATARGCPLRIVHAFLWPLYNVPLGPVPGEPLDTGLQAAAERILADATERARRTGPALEISTDLQVCAPAAALIDASHDAALVVVRHRGLGGFTGLLVGSVGVQTAARAACPAIVMRDGGPTGDPGDPRPAAGHVVVGVDGSDTSSVAVEFAFAHAALHRVVAVHVYQLPAFAVSSDPRIAADVDGLRDVPTRLLTDALAGCRDKYPEMPVRQKVVHGAPADVLVAESAGATLTRRRVPRPRWIHRPATQLHQPRRAVSRAGPGPDRPRPPHASAPGTDPIRAGFAGRAGAGPGNDQAGSRRTGSHATVRT